jgi:hypothetical protein
MGIGKVLHGAGRPHDRIGEYRPSRQLEFHGPNIDLGGHPLTPVCAETGNVTYSCTFGEVEETRDLRRESDASDRCHEVHPVNALKRRRMRA